ncbi:MAG: 4a-hydroxytetrahydrobiopterin dehydratase [Terriglobia bacterium]
MSNLAERSCVPCRGGVPPLKGERLQDIASQVPSWQVVDEHHLSKNFKLGDFKEALALVNRIGEIAEKEDHHPDLYLAWGKVRVDIWTHKINGLTESDFVLAAKIDALGAV